MIFGCYCMVERRLCDSSLMDVPLGRGRERLCSLVIGLLVLASNSLKDSQQLTKNKESKFSSWFSSTSWTERRGRG